MIDTKALRSRILDLAIQGKLTEQLPSDGTAEELYQQIQAEKQKLISEGKLKKEKPLPPVSPEEVPFEIPENWLWVRLGDIFTLQAGKFISAANISAEQDSDHQYKCFGGNGIRGYVSDYNTTGTHALIGRQGALCGNVNLAHDLFYATEHAVVVYQYCDVDVNWIFYGLTELNLNQYATSVAQPGLAVGKIEKVLIQLPPLAEQKRIVERVEEIFRLLDTIDQAQEKYSADTEILKSKLITAGIQGKLTQQLPSDGTAEELYQQIQAEKQKFIKEGKLKKEKPLPPIADEEIPFEIPENWKWVRLKDICTKIVDGDHNPPKGIDYKTEYMMLSAQNIIDDKITALDKVRYLSEEVFTVENERTKLQNGDILLTIVGTIGRSCVYNTDDHYCFQRSVSVITTLAYNYYLKYAFDNEHTQKFMNDNATGAAQLGFYLNKLEKLIIPLPPLAEQKRIAETLEKVLGAIE